MVSQNHKWTICFLALGSLALTGCVKEDIDGAVHTFTYELWVPLSMIFGGLAAAVVGWLLRQSIVRLGYGLLIGGPLFALLLGPSMLLDKTIVDQQHVSSKSGIWAMTAKHDVNFDDVTTARVTKEERRGRRGRRETNYYLVLERKSGEPAKLSLGNDLIEHAAPRILEQLRARHVTIIDQSR